MKHFAFSLPPTWCGFFPTGGGGDFETVNDRVNFRGSDYSDAQKCVAKGRGGEQ